MFNFLAAGYARMRRFNDLNGYSLNPKWNEIGVGVGVGVGV